MKQVLQNFVGQKCCVKKLFLLVTSLQISQIINITK